MSAYYVGIASQSGSLYHYGILGQKWGIRRFQNPDGTLTPSGRERYNRLLEKKGVKVALNKIDQDMSGVIYQTNAMRRHKFNIDSRIKKGANTNEVDRLSSYSKKIAKRIAANEKSISYYKKLTSKIIKDAEKNGFTIKSKPVMRNIRTGKRAAVSVLSIAGYVALSQLAFPWLAINTAMGPMIGSSAVLSPLAGAAGLLVPKDRVQGTKYKVSAKYK